MPTLKAVVFLVVAYFIYQNFQRAFTQIQEQGFQFNQIKWMWVAVAGLLYLLGSLPMGIFWHQILRAMGQDARLGKSLRAFFIGHMGKYVPGKALVVVLRTALVRGPKVDTTVAAVAVFVETLTMVAVGAVYAAVIIGLLYFDQTWLLILAVSMAICASVPTFPPLFRKIVVLLRVKKLNPKIEENLQGVDFRVMGIGWFADFIGWTLMGASLLAVFYAIPGTNMAAPLTLFPLMTATVCLAMVAGFVTPIPGGIGIRELVIMGLLETSFSPATAAVAAVLLRFSWMVSEVLLSIILYGTILFQTDTPPPPESLDSTNTDVSPESESV
ncbi:MAG: hypothetical protein COA78_08160 [Blastopirellula sp.]|nr:MAG: hypothetical protein COA78_08160 [Blastopirellula sp.]